MTKSRYTLQYGTTSGKRGDVLELDAETAAAMGDLIVFLDGEVAGPVTTQAQETEPTQTQAPQTQETQAQATQTQAAKPAARKPAPRKPALRTPAKPAAAKPAPAPEPEPTE